MSKRSRQAVHDIEVPSRRRDPLPAATHESYGTSESGPKSRAQSAGQTTPFEEPAASPRAQRPAETRRPAVCLLSDHPAVLSQLAHAIPKNRFRVLSERLMPRPAGALQALGRAPATAGEGRPFPQAGGPQFALPVAGLYVVDGLLPRTASAAIIQQILDADPAAAVLVVAEKGAEADCFDLLALGAQGLLTYDETARQLTEALKCLEAGGFWLSPLRLARFMAQLRRGRQLKPAVAPLSRRQQEILERLARNLTNKEIAHELNISERTVKFHVSNLLEKFQVRGRMELALACNSESRFGFPEVWQEAPRPGGEFSKTGQQALPRVFPTPKQDRGLPSSAQARRTFASVS